MATEQKATQEEPCSTFKCCDSMNSMPRIVSRMMGMCCCSGEVQDETEESSGKPEEAQNKG